jgi:hypothetical protein
MVSLSVCSCTPGTALGKLAEIDAELERKVESGLTNEQLIERCLFGATSLETTGRSYWLILMRLAEAALLCAGNYADNCEYKAAGDFIVNPREILIYRKTGGSPMIKKRHGRLSEQFGVEGGERLRWMKLFRSSFFLKVTKPPLLQHLTKTLRESAWISRDYIHRLEQGQQHIARTLAFLAAWRISDSEELYRRLKVDPEKERTFAESHLCRFDTRVFHQIGASLRRCLAVPDATSPFLAANL